jgi:hypothetical protein
MPKRNVSGTIKRGIISEDIQPASEIQGLSASVSQKSRKKGIRPSEAESATEPQPAKVEIIHGSGCVPRNCIMQRRLPLLSPQFYLFMLLEFFLS